MNIVTWLLVVGVVGCVTSPGPVPARQGADCPNVILILDTASDEGWTAEDDLQVSVSIRRCTQLFGVTSCLHKLTKLGTHRYTAVCRTGFPNTGGE